MLELLETLWALVLGLGHVVWDLLSVVTVFLGDTLLWLHVESPRLEGLLLGVALSWLLLRRDRHPLLRVLSSPLKLVLDILDLAWDQVAEIVKDVWGVAVGWLRGSLGWLWGRVTGCWSWGLGLLTDLRDRLRKKE